MAINPNTLMEEGKCYQCVGMSQADVMQLALLARVVEALPASAPVMKAARMSTGSVAPGIATVTITWPEAFADANYTVSASIVDATVSFSSLTVIHVLSATASQVSVLVRNQNVGNLTGIVHVIAVHD